MLSQPVSVVYVATHSELMRKSYYRRLWIAARNLHIPRRAWLDEIADTLRDFDGMILYRSGIRYNIPDIDEVFGDDPDVRWLGYYFLADQYHKYPKHKSRKLQRLELIDLYFRIRYPQLAKKFGK